MSRKEVTLSRLRIRHLDITHSYLLKKEEALYCVSCQKPYTIKHILTECINLKQIRQTYYQTTNLKQIFYQIDLQKLLEYIKEAHIYNKILKFSTKKCVEKMYL